MNESPSPLHDVQAFHARVQVFSEMSYRETTIGVTPGKEVQGPRTADRDYEPQHLQYTVDGDVIVEPSGVLLRYYEPKVTGMTASYTILKWDTDTPNVIELSRGGDTSFYLQIDPQHPQQMFVYQTPFGTIEAHMTLTQVCNLTEGGVGRIVIAYNLDYLNHMTCSNLLRLDIRREEDNARRSDLRPKTIAKLENKPISAELEQLRDLPLRPKQPAAEPSLDEFLAQLELLKQQMDRE